jgi:hypothetical protein
MSVINPQTHQKMNNAPTKQVIPTAEFFNFMKELNEKPSTMFQLITRNLLRKYFTLSYHDTNEYEFEVSTDDSHPVVLEAWRRGKGRKSVSAKHTLPQEEASIIREIFHTIQGQ